MNKFDKKLTEKFVLERYIKKANLKCEILSFENSKKIFGRYNNENPDFVILFNGKYIGIELFRICETKSEYTREYNCINTEHYFKTNNKIMSKNNFSELTEGEKKKNFRLIQIYDIGEVLEERILEKVKKLKYYVTPEIWLLGYSLKPYNSTMIKVMLDDKIEDKIRKYFKNLLKENKRIKKIIIFDSVAEKNKTVEISI